MNELTPQDTGDHAGSEQVSGRRGRRRSMIEPQGAPDLFTGLRIVLHECDRRAVVVRCLTNLRWLAQRGAEVVLFDGSAQRNSVDGSLAAVKKRFPFVVVQSRCGSGASAILDQAIAPLEVDTAPPRWILALSADLEVDRFQMQAMLRELSELPEGSMLVPGVVGPDGAEETRGFGFERDRRCRPVAWVARRSDLTARPVSQLAVHASRTATVLASRPVVRGR